MWYETGSKGDDYLEVADHWGRKKTSWEARLENQRKFKTWVEEVARRDNQWGCILSKNVGIGLNHAMHPVWVVDLWLCSPSLPCTIWLQHTLYYASWPVSSGSSKFLTTHFAFCLCSCLLLPGTQYSVLGLTPSYGVCLRLGWHLYPKQPPQPIFSSPNFPIPAAASGGYVPEIFVQP